MAVVIPYVPQAWTDGVSSCSAARNLVHEDGIRDAHYMPAARVTHNAAQSIAHNTVTALAFNTERFDQAGNAASTIHDTSTNNSRLTCRHAGVYLITGHYEWSASPVGGTTSIRLNGSTIIGQHTIDGDHRRPHVSTLYALAVNDYVELVVFQFSGGAINVNSAANYSPEFMLVRVA